MRDLLRRLGFADDDARDLLAAEPAGAQQALLEERRDELVALMGTLDQRVDWPFDPGTPWLQAWTLLAALPDVRAHHAARGVPADVSWASLRDLGRHAALDRRLHGSPGLRKGWWLQLHFRGLIYELGRLQFELRRDHLSVHIPATGPLLSAACDASFAHAAEFFEHRIAMCTSWLLDPTLAAYLPADSNIVGFQRRFELVDEGSEADADVLEFVFHRLEADLGELPQRTTLERALVGHMRAGGHWRSPTGRLAL